ncbi:hypothetical protein ACFPZ4_33550, partial [Micromonospora harpali]
MTWRTRGAASPEPASAGLSGGAGTSSGRAGTQSGRAGTPSGGPTAVQRAPRFGAGSTPRPAATADGRPGGGSLQRTGRHRAGLSGAGGPVGATGGQAPDGHGTTGSVGAGPDGRTWQGEHSRQGEHGRRGGQDGQGSQDGQAEGGPGTGRGSVPVLLLAGAATPAPHASPGTSRRQAGFAGVPLPTRRAAGPVAAGRPDGTTGPARRTSTPTG